MNDEVPEWAQHPYSVFYVQLEHWRYDVEPGDWHRLDADMVVRGWRVCNKDWDGIGDPSCWLPLNWHVLCAGPA